MNYEDIKRLIDDMGNSKIDELNIEFPDGVKISMKKDKAPTIPMQTPGNVQYITVPENKVVDNKSEESKKEEEYKRWALIAFALLLVEILLRNTILKNIP